MRRVWMCGGMLLLVGAVCGSAARAQMIHADGPSLSFEVATIKPSDGSRFMIQAPGKGTLQHVAGTARGLVAQAYMLPPNIKLVFGGPEWVDKQIYRVEGKIPDDLFVEMQKMTTDEKQAKVNQMLRSLLADRFKLKTHLETREMPVYELVAKGKELTAQGDVKLTRSAEDDPAPHMVGMRGIDALSMLFIAANVSMEEFAHQLLGGMVDRPVVDKTGIAGRYSFRFPVAVAGTPLESSYPKQSPAFPEQANENTPNFFTAIQDLGLKLVPAKDQVEVLVIDHIELPTEN